MLDEALKGRLESALEGAERWSQVAGALTEGGAAPFGEDPVWPLVAAFEYDLVSPKRGERRDRWGPFAPMAEFNGHTVPPPLDQVDDKWLDVWSDAAEAVADPVSTARLEDLLWVRRVGKDAYLHAQAAIGAYEALAGRWTSLGRADCLVRALELAREINDRSAAQRIIDSIEGACRESMAAEKPEPGVALDLVEALMRLPRREQPAAIDVLLDEALKTYASDPWIVESILDLQASRAAEDADRTRDIRREQVERWRIVASGASGLLRHMQLEHVLELARAHGLGDEADQIRGELQSMSIDDLDLKEVSVKVSIPTDALEGVVSAIVGEGSAWRDALTRFGSYGPPTGDVEKNREAVREQAAQTPLLFLLHKVIVDDQGAPIRNIASEEDHYEVALSEREQLAIGFFAVQAVEVLQRIRDAAGIPSDAELTEFFTTSLIGPDIAERLARALVLHWSGYADDAASVIVPRIEAVIRGLARATGAVVIQEPIGAKPGGVRRLGEVLWLLSGSLDESWRRYLWNLLADPVGVNLRNRISHGLVERASDSESALLLHVACFLRLLTAAEPAQTSG